MRLVGRRVLSSFSRPSTPLRRIAGLGSRRRSLRCDHSRRPDHRAGGFRRDRRAGRRRPGLAIDQRAPGAADQADRDAPGFATDEVEVTIPPRVTQSSGHRVDGAREYRDRRHRLRDREPSRRRSDADAQSGRDRSAARRPGRTAAHARGHRRSGRDDSRRRLHRRAAADARSDRAHRRSPRRVTRRSSIRSGRAASRSRRGRASIAGAAMPG